MLDPTFKEVRIGTAEVREVFKVPKIGAIAGCMVTDGRITRAGETQARLLRDNVVVHEGKIGSLRRFKDDVSEVKSGFECGIGLELQRHQGRRHHRSLHDGASRGHCVTDASNSDRERSRSHVERIADSNADHGLMAKVSSRSRRRPDPPGAERAAEPRRRARPGHRLHHADPRAGLARPQIARVFYTTLGDPKARRETAKALERATPFFRRQVGARLRLRRVPELEFRFDETIAHQDRIEQILRDLHDEEAARGATRDDDAPRRRRSATLDDATATDPTRAHCDEIRKRQRFVITSHARPGRRRHRLAAGDGLRAARISARTCASSAATRRRRRCWCSPASTDIEIADRVDDPGDAVIVMECGDLTRTGVAGLERGFVINIDHHPGNTMYGAVNWFDVSAAACGEMVFDLMRRARRAADARHRDARLHRDPDRHRVVPLLEHHAAHVRDLPAVHRGRRRTRRPWRAASSTATASAG